jgi:hypothetical protein
MIKNGVGHRYKVEIDGVGTQFSIPPHETNKKKLQTIIHEKGEGLEIAMEDYVLCINPRLLYEPQH